MAGTRCVVCGTEEFLPFRCKLCKQPHCVEHRLPENHRCAGLGEYRAAVRQERHFGTVPEGLGGVVRIKPPPPWRKYTEQASGFLRSSVTHLLLGAILLVGAIQLLGGLAIGAAFAGDPAFGVDLVTCALALGACGPFAAGPLGLLAKPWSLLTNVFAHAGLFHFFFNALVLYFFGLELERRIGRRNLATLFLAAGIAASVAQATIFQGGVVLGASGGIMAILGTLTILAPNMRVIVFIVPAPLWALTLFFVALDVSGLLYGSAGIANLAHLLGLAIGLAYGLRLQRRGVMPEAKDTWASQRRGP